MTSARRQRRLTVRRLALGQLGEVAPLHVVVRLEEDLAQTRLADRVVLELARLAATGRRARTLNLSKRWNES